MSNILSTLFLAIGKNLDHHFLNEKYKDLNKREVSDIKMTSRIVLPSALSGATLTRSGEGVSLSNRTASVPASTAGARTLNPSRMSMTSGVTEAGQMTSVDNSEGYSFDMKSLIWVVLVPVVVWILLYSAKFNMVTDLEDGKRVINTKKLVMWTIIISVVILVLLWLVLVAYPNRKTI